MDILDSSYFYDIYCSKRADECSSLEEAMDCVCPECSCGDEILRYYIESHDKDEGFETEIEMLGYAKIARLLRDLTMTSYDIFKPWCKRQYLSLIAENDEDLTANERHWKHIATEEYNLYKEAFDKVDETLD